MSSVKFSKEQFMAVYVTQLTDCFANHKDYSYVADRMTPLALAEKMYPGLKAGTASKDGVAIQRTLKILGIKNTYKALKEALG